MMRLKTIIIFCMLSMTLFAQKTPKGKLVSYSHCWVNPEIPIDISFDLTWFDGKGSLTIKRHYQEDDYVYTDEVEEDVFRQAADFIKEKKLNAIRVKKLTKKDRRMMPTYDPGIEGFSLHYNGKSISCDLRDLSEQQIKDFVELEKLVKEAVHFVVPPSGRLVECSLSSVSTLPGRGGTFQCLSVPRQGLAPELVMGRSSSPLQSEEDSRYMVSTEDVQRLQQLILQEGLYKIARPSDEALQGDAPLRRVFLKYDDGKVFSARYQQATKDVARAERVLSDFFQSLTQKYQPAPQGKLLYYSHTLRNPEIPIANDFSLSWNEGKGTLTIQESSNLSTSEYIGEAAEELFHKVVDIIREKQLYSVIKKEEDQEPMPYAYPGREMFSIHFENQSVILNNMDLSTEQKKAFEELETFIKGQSKEVSSAAGYPEGKMVYCSCAYTHHGLPVGTLQRSYYELIADEGKAPKVVYFESRGSNDDKKTEYRATQKDVTQLSNILRDLKIFKINGYQADEQMMGGTTYRIHMEFSSGEKLHASWCTSHPDGLASEAYATILRYMEKMAER